MTLIIYAKKISGERLRIKGYLARGNDNGLCANSLTHWYLLDKQDYNQC